MYDVISALYSATKQVWPQDIAIVFYNMIECVFVKNKMFVNFGSIAGFVMILFALPKVMIQHLKNASFTTDTFKT